MKISIIIPFYNTNQTYLKQLCETIQSSHTDNFEFIFINDGSNREISNFIEKFCEENEYKYFEFSNNLGVSNARNKGLELASNKHIMFLDSDDLINFTFLNDNKWNENADLIMFTDNIFTNNVKIPLVQNPNKIELNTKDISLLYFNNTYRLNMRSACCKILSKQLIDSYHLRFDNELPFYEDAFFMTSYYKEVKNFEAYSNILYYYRIHNKSSSKKHNKEYIDKYQLYFSKYLASFSNEPNFVNSLFKDTFFSVLTNKFTRSVKSLHISFAYKLLKANFLNVSSKYIYSISSEGTFEHRMSSLLLRKKYFRAYFYLSFYRIKLSFGLRINKIHFFKRRKE